MLFKEVVVLSKFKKTEKIIYQCDECGKSIEVEKLDFDSMKLMLSNGQAKIICMDCYKYCVVDV